MVDFEQHEPTEAALGSNLPHIRVEPSTSLGDLSMARTINSFLEGVGALNAFSRSFIENMPDETTLIASLQSKVGDIEKDEEGNVVGGEVGDEERMRRLWSDMKIIVNNATEIKDPEELGDENSFYQYKIEQMVEDVKKRVGQEGKQIVLAISDSHDIAVALHKVAGIIKHDLGNAMLGLYNPSHALKLALETGFPEGITSEDLYKDICAGYEGLYEYTEKAIPTILGIEFTHEPMTATYAASLMNTYMGAHLRNNGIKFTMEWPGAAFEGVQIDYPGFLLRPYAKNLAYNAVDAIKLKQKQAEESGEKINEEPEVRIKFMYPLQSDLTLPSRVTLDKDNQYVYIKTSDNGPGYPQRMEEKGFVEGDSGFKDSGIEPTGGTGLGMEAHQEFATRAGGALIVKNPRDVVGAIKGADTYLVLPFAA